MFPFELATEFTEENEKGRRGQMNSSPDLPIGLSAMDFFLIFLGALCG